jgi:hypothetical protein
MDAVDCDTSGLVGIMHKTACLGIAIATAMSAMAAGVEAQVTTSQYDDARTNATTVERVLTPANVNAAQFGKVFSYSVDGDVYAQPLYLPRVDMGARGRHDVVYIATEHDSVYAFDAAGSPASPLWHVSFLDSTSTTVPADDVGCPFIAPEIGITPTPVIDVASGTIYVLARTKETSGRSWYYVQRLHALDVATGAEKFGGPVEIHARVKGTGAGSVLGVISFDPLRELPRAGLALAGGQVYLTWGSSCDAKPYHGWVMAYDAHALKQTAALNTSPDSNESGIWQSDMAPAVTSDGSVYVVTGNGVFDAGKGGRNYGDSVLRLRLSGDELTIADVFTPANEDLLRTRDLDLGSGGPVLISTPSRALLAIGGKQGPLHVLDAAKLSGGPLQVLPAGRGIYSAPAYSNGHLFVLGSNDVLKKFAIADQLSAAPVAAGTASFENPGAAPVVSSNGNRDAVVWLIETKVWNAYQSTKPSVLHAYDAETLKELYTSEQNAARDRAGVAVRFTVPTIAGGRVYVGAKSEVDVYGLLSRR